MTGAAAVMSAPGTWVVFTGAAVAAVQCCTACPDAPHATNATSATVAHGEPQSASQPAQGHLRVPVATPHATHLVAAGSTAP